MATRDQLPCPLASRVELSARLQAALLALARAGAPDEVCGVLLTDGALIWCPNTHECPQDGFEMDLRRLGWHVVDKIHATWHSHPRTALTPSPADRRMLARSQVPMLLVGVRDARILCVALGPEGTLVQTGAWPC